MINLLNFIFPPKCIFCGEMLKFDNDIEVCRKCYSALPLFKDNTEYFFSYVTGANNFNCIICLFEYSGIIKDSIKRYKFFNKAYYYKTFAGFLAEKVNKALDSIELDIIISVPLYKDKEFDRGYNQAYLISKVVSKETKIPEYSGFLERIRNTDAQSLLAREGRIENIKNAFRVKNPDKIKDKNILLLDDIFTTGSTIDECSRVLKAAGAKNVVAAVIASGRKLRFS